MLCYCIRYYVMYIKNTMLCWNLYSAKISWRFHLSSWRCSSTLRQHCSWVSGNNISSRCVGKDSVKLWILRSQIWRHFYLHYYVNQHVYSECINDIQHLKHIITDANHSITPYVFIRVLEELQHCLDVCKARKEATSSGTEQVWNVQKFSFTWGRFKISISFVHFL